MKFNKAEELLKCIGVHPDTAKIAMMEEYINCLTRRGQRLRSLGCSIDLSDRLGFLMMELDTIIVKKEDGWGYSDLGISVISNYKASSAISAAAGTYAEIYVRKANSMLKERNAT